MNINNHAMIKYCCGFFFLANCGYQELQFLSTLLGNDSVPRVDDLMPVEGTTIAFSCPSGTALIGPDSATCMENGKWEPDPGGLTCTGKLCNLYNNLHS